MIKGAVCHRPLQDGQSLVEFIVVVPWFFVILAGIMTIFYMQNKHFVDVEAKLSLSLSSPLFSQSERFQGQWDEAHKQSESLLKKILDESLNSSRAWTSAGDKKDGVYLDKVPVNYQENSDCQSENTYALNSKNENKFSFSTCTGKNGYDRRGFEFGKLLNKMPLAQFKGDGSSLFYPAPHMAWKERVHLPRFAVQDFLRSPQGVLFSQKAASVLFPEDSGEINSNCFMEPFEPVCRYSHYAGKMERAARDGANLQVAQCYAEMVAQCGGSGPGFPICVAKGIADIQSSLKLGAPASSCGLTNSQITATFALVKAKTVADFSRNMIYEAEQRKK